MKRILFVLAFLPALAFAQGYQPVRANCPSCVLVAQQLTLSSKLVTPLVDSTSTLSLGTSTATGVTIGRSGQSLSLATRVSSYNGTATAGSGVSPIRAYGSLSAVTTGGTAIVSYTPAAQGVFELGANEAVTSWTSGVVAVQVAFTDCHGNAVAYILQGENNTGGPTSSLGATGGLNHYSNTICASAATITIKTVNTGVATADFYGWIRQVN